MIELNDQIRQLKSELINYKVSKSFNPFVANKKQELIDVLENTASYINSLIDNHEKEIKELKQKNEIECVKRELCAYYYGAGMTEISYFIKKSLKDVVETVNNHRQKPFLFHNHNPIKNIKTSNKPFYSAYELGIK